MKADPDKIKIAALCGFIDAILPTITASKRKETEEMFYRICEGLDISIDLGYDPIKKRNKTKVILTGTVN